MSTPETREKQAIKEYLSLRGYFHFPITQGLGAYRGIPDRIAVKNGKVYAVEIKAVGKSGKRSPQSEHQKIFQADWERAGGVYILGGIDEVMKNLI
jgi:hypothetical protein